MSLETLIDKAKDRINLEKRKRKNLKALKNERKDQFVILTIDVNGAVTNITNDWNEPESPTSYDSKHPCDFKTPVNIGKTITWIGTPDKDHLGAKIKIEYILMNNTSGNQVLKSKSYNRGDEDVVVGKVKKKNIKRGDIEEYYIVYSVNDKMYILDPMMEVHGEV